MRATVEREGNHVGHGWLRSFPASYLVVCQARIFAAESAGGRRLRRLGIGEKTFQVDHGGGPRCDHLELRPLRGGRLALVAVVLLVHLQRAVGQLVG